MSTDLYSINREIDPFQLSIAKLCLEKPGEFENSPLFTLPETFVRSHIENMYAQSLSYGCTPLFKERVQEAKNDLYIRLITPITEIYAGIFATHVFQDINEDKMELINQMPFVPQMGGGLSSTWLDSQVTKNIEVCIEKTNSIETELLEKSAGFLIQGCEYLQSKYFQIHSIAEEEESDNESELSTQTEEAALLRALAATNFASPNSAFTPFKKT